MKEPKSYFERRLFFVFISVLFLFLIIILNLGRIQILNSDELKAAATDQQTRYIPISAERGAIYDRNGVKLAFSVKSYTVWFKPEEIENLDEAIDTLKGVIELDESLIKEIIGNSTTKLVKVFQKIDLDTANMIRALKIKGVWISDDIKRVYPYGDFASHVLGHTDADNKGVYGIESYFETELGGEPGKLITNTDGSGRQLPYASEKKYNPIDGYSVVLTIDEVIQHYTEKALEKAFELHDPLRVMAIVLDAESGDILSMASLPDYNPNTPREALFDYYTEKLEESESDKEKVLVWSEMWRNPIVSDIYEPGSTFKLLTGAIGYEENVTSFNSEYYCNGYVEIFGVQLRCWSYKRPHGHQTFLEGLQNSCNPVFIEIARRLGAEKLYEYIYGFGFGERTGIKLPNESSGDVMALEKVGPVELGVISFGHSLESTPLQMVSALNVIANNGVKVKPRIVKELLDTEGNIVQEFEVEEQNQIISEKTAIDMRLAMETVVTEGSGKKAYIPGYRIGGKTGTSNKFIKEEGQYSEERVYSSFAAIAPIDKPRVTVLVVVDEPKDNHFGSVVAAPIVRDILEDTLRYLQIEPEFDNDEITINTPNFIGLTLNEAKEVARKNGLTISLPYKHDVEDQSVIIVEQYPKWESIITANSNIILYTEVDAVDDNQ